MTPLLITLWWGVSTPVLAQEDLPEAGLESPAELSEMAAVFELRRADTGFRRKWLRRAGGSGCRYGVLLRLDEDAVHAAGASECGDAHVVEATERQTYVVDRPVASTGRALPSQR